MVEALTAVSTVLDQLPHACAKPLLLSQTGWSGLPRGDRAAARRHRQRGAEMDEHGPPCIATPRSTNDAGGIPAPIAAMASRQPWKPFTPQLAPQCNKRCPCKRTSSNHARHRAGGGPDVAAAVGRGHRRRQRACEYGGKPIPADELAWRHAWPCSRSRDLRTGLDEMPPAVAREALRIGSVNRAVPPRRASRRSAPKPQHRAFARSSGCRGGRDLGLARAQLVSGAPNCQEHLELADRSHRQRRSAVPSRTSW
ncbi:hypothetical protein ACU4GD_10745 [Cupriavidus basilensis]